jgi:23S rRNA pseudouridine1911/1915/1917 synthase
VLLVINKPASLVVHPAAGIHSGTLANALAFHFQNLPRLQAKRVQASSIVLIEITSGLMVVAKTESSMEKLADQFRDRTVFKSYVALVQDNLESESGLIDQPLARDQVIELAWLSFAVEEMQCRSTKYGAVTNGSRFSMSRSKLEGRTRSAFILRGFDTR